MGVGQGLRVSMATSLRLRRRLGEKKLPQKVNSLLAAGTTSGGVRVRWVRVQVRELG